MPRTKKIEKLYSIDNDKKEILIPVDNRDKLTEKDKNDINFYSVTLGYKYIPVAKEEKVRKAFTIEAAKKYIKSHKGDMKAFEAAADSAKKPIDAFKSASEKLKYLKENLEKAKEDSSIDVKATNEAIEKQKIAVETARKNMISANRKAFEAQKQYFKATYGDTAYETVLSNRTVK